ncbi:ribokinase, putative [Entamoeba invadens IP1]|uniref:Ribokinase n=1 Tax=Entamoeba invadens TaxID=33085 RepID=S0B349_ENTIV|nr:ribokinase, putative [Entamoeba invadens IP1]ELP93296.1 ribokinase, putative [Entamoeba invadens IP1]BAN42220.1 ribokinase, putative [Entamoeba invadens]|eukprot:XP_004260067.1 ribokinase, putative [Entamoeba invadens IP1]
MSVVIVGSSNTDLIGYCDNFPEAGETVIGGKFHTGFGGKGANQCVMASKFKDVPVKMVTFLGKDSFGENTLKNYKECGIDTTDIGFCDEATGCAMITVDKTGQNQIVVLPGANFSLLPAFLKERESSIFKEGSVIVCQNEIPIETTRTALYLAKKNKCHTLWNPAPAPRTFDIEMIKDVDVLIVNTNESMQIGGEKTAELSAKKLHEQFGVVVVVTLGGNGCLVFGNEVTKVDVAPVKAIDTTGAGDAFVGSFARCWAKGIDFVNSAKMSAKIATSSVLKKGTQSSYPNAEEIEKIIN